MSRINLIRKVTTDGYKLLTIAGDHAVYSDENDELTLAIAGAAVKLSRAELNTAAAARAITANGNADYLAAIRDAILDSLSPITLAEDTEIRASSLRYFSAFAPKATWESVAPSDAADVLADIKKLNASILGPSQASNPAYIFLRQRYPNLRFDISIDQPSYQLRESCVSQVPFTLIVPWRAYLKPGSGSTSANPLVAAGYLVDVIQFDAAGYPTILSRKFIVERITDPVHFAPVTLPLIAPKSPLSVDALDSDFKSLLRETTVIRTTLLSISAFFASLNPMVSILISSPHLANVIQMVVATIASLAALAGMVILVLTKIVNAIDEGESGLVKIAGAVQLAGEAAGWDEARVREAEILNGSVFVSPDDEVDGVLREEVGVIRGMWQRIISGGITRPAAPAPSTA